MNSEDFAGIRQKIKQEMVKARMPSFSIAVARHGEMLWEEAFGWANREKRIAATPHTLYSLASTTKPFVGTGLMKLVEQGKLELDKPINNYLAADSQLKVWIGNPEDVTVRRVANHTAGLPGHMNFYSAEELSRKPPMEESIRRYGNIVTLPGERYRYSNIGYGILDHLLERLSGMSFADFMRKEFFLPLDMPHASVDIGPGLEEFAAERYEGDGTPIPFYDVDHRGASSIYCSAHDLVRFGMFHLRQLTPEQNAALSDESVASMHVPTADINNMPLPERPWPPASGYGIGWVIEDCPLGPYMSHAGGMGGTVAQLVLVPREGIAMAAMANTFCDLPHSIDRQIMPVLLPGCEDKLPKEMKKPAVPLTSIPPELLGDWRGKVCTYEKELPLTLSFKACGDIHAKVGEQLTALVNGASLVDGWLTGSMAGSIETGDSNRRSRHPYHHLGLDLRLRGNVLNGAIIARAGNSLSHWAELRKEGT